MRAYLLIIQILDTLLTILPTQTTQYIKCRIHMQITLNMNIMNTKSKVKIRRGVVQNKLSLGSVMMKTRVNVER